ncbi:MAG TPA: hypothetical protein VJJ81_03030, partial [Candidatus Babeliales bacterium]|nr:hypothetical protein [Candidatus Babeliales bacterium]
MPVNNNFLKQNPVKITRRAPSNNLLVIILGALAALTGSVNNQEATVTKNPMEQVRLEFQKLRAKNNLFASSTIEQTTITEYNCPTLYQTIAAVFNPGIKIKPSSKLFVPTIYVTQSLKSTSSGSTNNLALLKYTLGKRDLGVLLIDQTLLEKLT